MTKTDNYLQHGKYSKKCPGWLLDEVKAIDNENINEEYVKRVLRIIAKIFDPSNHTITTTKNIRESRLTTVDDILDKKLSSCGAKASVVASVFRSLGVPTKIIHGRYVEKNPNMRHAWNEILLGDNTWKPFDIDGKKRGIGKFHRKELEVVDWEEIEDRIDKI